MRHTRARGRPSGFTFIEVLVIVVLLGIIALIGSVEVSRASQRARLEGTAQNLRNWLSTAVNEMQRPRCPSGSATCATSALTQYEVFVQVGAQNADGTTTLSMYVDDDANGLLSTTSDRLISTFTLPSTVVLAPSVAPNPVDCLYGGTGCTVTTAKTHVASQNWAAASGNIADADADNVTIARALRLDFHNRAIGMVACQPPATTCTVSTSINAGVAKLALTLKNMTSSGGYVLTPLISDEIWISPVWNVTVHKGVWNGTKFVY